jgi:hypothetical protein
VSVWECIPRQSRPDPHSHSHSHSHSYRQLSHERQERARAEETLHKITAISQKAFSEYRELQKAYAAATQDLSDYQVWHDRYIRLVSVFCGLFTCVLPFVLLGLLFISVVLALSPF